MGKAVTKNEDHGFKDKILQLLFYLSAIIGWLGCWISDTW